MKTISKITVALMCSTAAMPALAQEAAPSSADAASTAQEPAAKSANDTASAIVVTGIRKSLQSSAQRKKNTNEVMDTISAEDIGKLPDNNVAATLSRVPGVQAYRFGGESSSPVGQGSGLTIRGLSGQTSSQVDGRAYMTAGGREFNVEGASPGMVAGVDVYKNPSAEHIEGGIGGLINIRTRQPLDFKGTVVSASVGGRYNDLGKKVQPELFALGSTRWNVGDGEMGLLLAGSYARSFNRGDNNPAGGGTSIRRAIAGNSAEYAANVGTGLNLNPAYVGRSDVTYLADVANPLALSEAARANLISTVTEGHNIFQEDYMRTRKGLNGAFQYKPTPGLEFYLAGNYTYFQYHQNYRFLNFSNSRYVEDLATTPFTMDQDLANRNLDGGTNELLSGTRLASGTFLRSTAAGIGGDEKSKYQTYLLAGGVKWQVNDRLDAHLDYSYVKADRSTDNRSVNSVPKAGLTWDVFRDLTSRPAELTLTGPDLADPTNWVLKDYNNSNNVVWDDNSAAAALDLRYRPENSFIKALKVGGRYSVLESRFNNYSFGGRPLTTDGLALTGNQSNGISANAVPDLFETSPNNFMNGEMGYRGGYLTFSPDALLGDNVRSRFPLAGILPEDNLAENVINRRYLRERTYAGYAAADFAFFDNRVQGNVGVRAVKANGFARAMVNSQQVQNGPIVIVPNETNTSRWDILPSANLSWRITPEMILRLGYGKGITRPSTDALNPSVSFNTANGLGNRGNSDLGPQKADNFDISLEQYFTPTNYVALALFYKNIDGFFSGITQCETIPTAPAYTGPSNNCSNGQYSVTQTVNAQKGWAKGFEISGQSFFDYPFVPQFLHNFGASGSFTYVDTKNPLILNGVLRNTPQPFTSKYNWTAAGFYEDGFMTARLVYTYRSESILFGAAANPVDGRYINAFGLLDASLSFKLPANLTLSLNAENLTKAAANRFVGEPGYATGIERQHFYNGRTFSAALRYRFGS